MADILDAAQSNTQPPPSATPMEPPPPPVGEPPAPPVIPDEPAMPPVPPVPSTDSLIVPPPENPALEPTTTSVPASEPPPKPKKKSRLGVLLAGLLLLVITIPILTVFVKQQMEIRSRAAGTCTAGRINTAGTCPDGVSVRYVWRDVNCNTWTECNGVKSPITPAPGSTTAPTITTTLPPSGACASPNTCLSSLQCDQAGGTAVSGTGCGGNICCDRSCKSPHSCLSATQCDQAGGTAVGGSCASGICCNRSSTTPLPTTVVGKSCTTTGGWPGTCTTLANCTGSLGAGIAWDNTIVACSPGTAPFYGCCGTQPSTCVGINTCKNSNQTCCAGLTSRTVSTALCTSGQQCVTGTTTCGGANQPCCASIGNYTSLNCQTNLTCTNNVCVATSTPTVKCCCAGAPGATGASCNTFNVSSCSTTDHPVEAATMLACTGSGTIRCCCAGTPNAVASCSWVQASSCPTNMPVTAATSAACSGSIITPTPANTCAGLNQPCCASLGNYTSLNCQVGLTCKNNICVTATTPANTCAGLNQPCCASLGNYTSLNCQVNLTCTNNICVSTPNPPNWNVCPSGWSVFGACDIGYVGKGCICTSSKNNVTYECKVNTSGGPAHEWAPCGGTPTCPWPLTGGKCCPTGSDACSTLGDKICVGDPWISICSVWDTSCPTGQQNYWKHLENVTSCNNITPTPTPTTAPQCINIIAYKDGNALSQAELNALHPGNTITLAFAPGGAATKVRFRVNTGTWNETTTKNTNGQFIWNYTLENATSFTIEAQWFDGSAWH